MNLFHRIKDRFRRVTLSKNDLEYYQPKNLEECFAALNEWMLKTVRTEFARLPEDRAVGLTHFSLGMGIRNAWRLWDQKSPLARYFKDTYGIFHADDASGIILTSYHRYLNHRVLRVEEQAKYYLDYWKEHKP